jgi:hypothetical protein
MNLKNKFQLVVMAALLGFAGAVSAGKQGLSFYGGLGLAAVVPSEVDGFEYDPTAAGSAFLGVEEDGWSFEYTGLSTMEAGTNVAGLEYSVSGRVLSLGYRTLEKSSGLYFLFSLGRSDFDVTYASNVSEDIYTADGNVYTVGMGMRLDRTERIELNYSFLALDETDGTNSSSIDVHMVSLRYLWGGSPYTPGF